MNKDEEQFTTNLAKTKQLPWHAFDNIDSARVPKLLTNVQISEKNTDGSYKEETTLFINNGISTIAIITKIPCRSVVAILDYLHGTIIKQDEHIFFTRNTQFHILSELELGKRYKLDKKNDFTSPEVIAIINFIHSHFLINPPKFIKNFIVAGSDFQIDFENKEVTHETIKENETYFKYFGCKLEDVKNLIPKYQEFLNSVIYDEDSLHNARLQPVYTMLVAMRLMSKTRFFISKSGVRTGKGLRHNILSSIFETKNVSLDSLSGMTSDLGWASCDGGEMLLVTESGAITQNMERHLKILATESTHTARAISKNYADINLTGVLTIDSNENILLSEDMKSRLVNIAFKDRPKGETDGQRERLFQQYWENFTKSNTASVGRVALPSAGLAALLDSFEYWKENNYQFDFKHVEMNNLQSITALDEVQLFVLGTLHKTGGDYVEKTDNDILQNLLRFTYVGKGSPQKRKDALSLIGMEECSIFKGKTLRVIKKSNIERFNKAMALYEQWLTEQ